MNTFIFIGVFLILTVHLDVANSTTNQKDSDVISSMNNQDQLLHTAGRQLRILWDRYTAKNEETFVGRCFGIVKRLRTIIPIVIFMLGVIMTKLGFLTLFSLKALGLLGILLVINVAGVAAKVATALSQKKEEKSPQIIHFHINKGKDSPYHIGHSGAWEDKADTISPSIEYHTNTDNSGSYNMYDKLLRDPYLRGYGKANR